MCELYEELLEEKNKELEQTETQLLACQQEIRRLRSICRNYEQDREINKEWQIADIEDILERLGARILWSVETKSEKAFTEEGKRAYKDLKSILLAVGNLTGMDMRNVIRLLEDIVLQKEEDMEISQLRLLLKIFDEHNWKGSYSIGKWTIGNGAYDLWFEIYYDQIAVVQCIAAGEIVMIHELKISEDLIVNCILEEFSHLTIK